MVVLRVVDVPDLERAGTFLAVPDLAGRRLATMLVDIASDHGLVVLRTFAEALARASPTLALTTPTVPQRKFFPMLPASPRPAGG